METWVRSEAYKRLQEAEQANNYALQRQIVDETIATTEGADRAFWLVVRSGLWVGPTVYRLDRMWSDLETAIGLAPSDARICKAVVGMAAGLAAVAEDRTRPLHVIQRIQHPLRPLIASALVQGNLGLLYMRQGRWRAALRSFARSQRDMTTWSPGRFDSALSDRYALFIHQARAGIRVGRVENARQDLISARGLKSRAPQDDPSHLMLGLAEAELAYAGGNLPDARRALQLAMQLLPSGGAVHQAWGHYLAQAELLAALIARAEGNPAGVHHFCTRAGQLAAEHNLAMTANRVRAIAAGAAW